MPGASARNFRSANRSEVLAHFLLSSWGTVSSVLPVDDYGIDFYCTLTEPVGRRSIVTDYYSLQVKSNDDPWVFKTSDAIKWLLDYPTPLFLGCVDKTKTILSIYHTMPRFLASFFETGAALELTPSSVSEGVMAQWSDGGQFSLSAPIIKVSLAELSEPKRLEELQKTFQHWVKLDNYNCDLKRVGILRFRMPASYTVNEIPRDRPLSEQGRWKVTPQQLSRAIMTLVEVADCVGHQLLGAQDREGALYAALLLRHLTEKRKTDLASDPRWSTGITPGGLSAIVDELNASMPGADYRFAAIDSLRRLLQEHPVVTQYLTHKDK